MRALMLFVALGIVPLPLAAADDPKPPEGWKEFSPRDKAFTVWMPDKGGRRTEREGTVRIRTSLLRVNLLNLEMNDGSTYHVSTITLPISLIRQVPLQGRIELFRDAFLEEVKGKVEGEKDLKQGQIPGKEYTISTGKGLARLRVYAQGSRIHRVSITGTKQQAEAQDADIFLESYKIPLAPPVVGPIPIGKDKLADKAATVFTGDLFPFLQSAVKEKRVGDSDVKGFTLSSKLYREAPETGGILIGFHVGLGKFVNNDIVTALQPIYRTKDGEKLGEWYGQKPGNPITIKAKDGYVVGGINIRVGLGIDQIALNFMKLDKDRLQVTDSYKSEVAGGMGGQPAVIGGQGYFFVGVFGNLNDQGAPCSLGLIAALK